MSEMGEAFSQWRAIKQEKKRSNLAQSTRLLEQSGIEFKVHNSGIHLVLTKGDQIIDYWPSTGLWWIRGTSNKRRGVHRLLAFMKQGARNA